MGIYSSSQFFGIFIGGFVGGWIAQHNPAAIYLVGAGLAGLWLIVAASMQDPPYLSSLMVNLEKLPPEPMMALVEKLKHTPGVAECFFNAEHGVAYLKFDSQQTDRQTILSISSNMKQQFAGNG